MNQSARLPPYSMEAEKGVLGSILIDSARVLELCSDNKISADSFHIPAHRHLFEQLQEMKQTGKAVDLLTVGEYLKQNGRLDSIGGYAFLEKLIDETPTSAHAEYYIGFVRQKHLLRQIIDKSTETIDSCYTETDEDAESILARTQSAFFDLSAASRVIQEQSIGETALDVCLQWQDIADGKRAFGLPPFLPGLQRRLGNFVQGNPYFVAAPPAGGKSVFMQNQMLYWAMNRVPCAIASLEMTRDKLVSRMMAELSSINAWMMYNNPHNTTPSVQAGRIESARKAARQLNGLPLHITDRPMDVDEFAAWGLSEVRKHKIKAIAVDYMQILGPPAKARLQGLDAVNYVCKKLQSFSKETGVITLVLSQITKLPRDENGNTRRFKQDDLYGGRMIDATSEGTIFVWQNGEGQDFFDIAKNRNGGVGLVETYFDKPYNRFIEPVRPTTGQEY